MFKKLKENDYYKIIPLLKDISHSKALIYSVVDLNSPGEIWVDNNEMPTCGWIQGPFSYFVGNPSNLIFIDHLLDYIFKEKLIQDKDYEFVMFPMNKDRKILEEKLKTRGCIEIQRQMFDFDIKGYEDLRGASNDEDDFEVKLIDEAFINKYDKAHDLLHSKDLFGLCLLKDSEWLSYCYSVAKGGGYAEISIESNEKYLKQGYGKRAAIEFIDYCINHQMVPEWSCWPFRQVSVHMAKSLGFKDKGIQPAYFFSNNM
jgi:hypothetical protein